VGPSQALPGLRFGRRKRVHEPEPTVKHLLYAYSRVRFGDSLDAVGLGRGETMEGEVGSECILIRLAMDASDLPANRNVWPAANTVLA
jgi:hypothetical protein